MEKISCTTSKKIHQRQFFLTEFENHVHFHEDPRKTSFDSFESQKYCDSVPFINKRSDQEDVTTRVSKDNMHFFANSPKKITLQQQRKHQNFNHIQPQNLIKMIKCQQRRNSGEQNFKKKYMFKRSMTEKNPKDDQNTLATQFPKRRICKITTQQKFEQECTEYIQVKHKQQVEELFRKVNRLMKQDTKKEEGNNYYQKIRKEALKKIEYMSYNQKYYDHIQVKRLYDVVENCNSLIHKRDQFTPNIYVRRNKENKKPLRHTFQLEKACSITEEDQKFRFTTITSIDDIQIPIQSKQSDLPNQSIKIQKKKISIKKLKMENEKCRSKMKIRLSDIQNICGQQIQKLKGIKENVNIFNYYCRKLDSGFEQKGAKLKKVIQATCDN